MVCARLACAVFVLGGALAGARASRAADARLTGAVDSAHVWRGLVLNTTPVLAADLDVRGLKVQGVPVRVGVRGVFDVGDEGGLIEGSHFSKIDFTVGLDLPQGFTLSYAEYVFPVPVEHRTYHSTREVGIGWRRPGWLEPAIVVYRDVGELDDLFVELALTRRVVLSEQARLDLEALTAYAGKRYARDRNAPRAGFHNYDLRGRLAYRPTETLQLTLHAAYTRSFRDSLPKQPLGFFGGVMVTVSY
jgi:hypothetical protein